MKKELRRPLRRKKLRKIYASMALVWLFGAFLLPRLAYASMLSDENIIKLTNEVRNGEGLDGLNANQLLTKAAYDKAEAIFAAQEFKHDIENRKFSNWVKESGYEYQSIGENLAIDFTTSENAMDAWLESPTHKKNILNPKFEEIGVAVKEDEFQGHKSLLVVQIFGKPAKGQNVASAQPAKLANLDSPELNNRLDRSDSMFLTNSAPKTLLVMRTMSGIEVYEKESYLGNDSSNLGDNMAALSQAVIYIVDYSRSFLIEYYWTIIVLILGVFSYSFITHKKRLENEKI